MIKKLLLIGIFTSMLGCQDQSTANQGFAGFPMDKHSKVELSSRIKEKPGSYALNGTKNSWPPLDKVPDNIANNLLAKNYYLVVDGSGSMWETGCSNGKEKINVAKPALKSFIKKLPADANLGMYVFDSRGSRETDPLSAINVNQITKSIDKVSTGDGTPLQRAIDHGYRSLTDQAKKQLGYGEYHLVVVTDGDANSGQDPRPIIKTILRDSPVVLHTIGFCIDESHALNVPGKTLYKSANNPKALAEGLESVLAESADFDVTSFGD